MLIIIDLKNKQLIHIDPINDFSDTERAIERIEKFILESSDHPIFNTLQNVKWTRRIFDNPSKRPFQVDGFNNYILIIISTLIITFLPWI